MNEWISVKDRLPKENGFVIGRSVGANDSQHSTGTIIIYFCSAMNKGEEFQSQHRATHVTLTHWMPLPDPPKVTSHVNAAIYSNKVKQHTGRDTIALIALYLFVISVRKSND